MTPFEVYKIYISLKTHFSNDKYDFEKYNGKLPLTLESFEKRNDKYYFLKLSKNPNVQKDCVGYFLGNWYFNEEFKWIGDLVGDESVKRYLAWKGNQESLFYNFSTEIDTLEENFNDLIKVPKGDYPKLFYKLNQKDISLDTVCIINKLVSFIEYWDKSISDTIYYPMVKKRIIKYEPFIKIDTKKYKDKIIQKYK
jgi:hypothetical protein